MKKKLKEELKSMSPDELASELKKRQDEIFKMKFGQMAAAVKNPLKARVLRREIAAIKTWMRQAEMDHGK